MKYLTKKDINKRIFGLEQYIPGSESVKDLSIKVTSGTSGYGPTVIVEKSAVEERTPRYLALLQNRLLRIGSQNANAYSSVNLALRHSNVKMVLVPDAKDLEHPGIGKIIQMFEPTELYSAPPSYMILILQRLKLKKPFPFNKLKYVFVSGGMVTTSLKDKIHALLPNLLECINEYGSAEGGSIAFSCPYLNTAYEDSDIPTFHPIPTMNIHIINPDEHSGIGEVVLTTHELKNYRTGDAGKITTEECPCGLKQTLRLYGRIDYDIVSCAGAIFTLPEIDKIFSSLEETVRDYRIELKDVFDNLTLHGEITIRIVPTTHVDTPEQFKKEIVEKLARELYVTPTRTLEELVKDGIFFQPTVLLEDEIVHGRKEIHLKKIVS
ncbi:MAG: hypothetical protein WD509_00930 [Candidatus Paceibacterota bacterium]